TDSTSPSFTPSGRIQTGIGVTVRPSTSIDADPSSTTSTTHVWLECLLMIEFSASFAQMLTPFLEMTNGMSYALRTCPSTTAHLTAALDDRYYNIESIHGEEGSRIAAESHMSAIHRVESIASMEDIDCDFERVEGYLFLGGKDTRKDLEKELEATHRAGLT